MQLFHSPFSPFARKVMVVAHEHGLADRITLLPTAAHPIERDAVILRHHPLAQVPTLIAGDGRVIADSRVICEYLDALGAGTLFARDGAARWESLSLQSTADGLLDAALLIRYELTARPPAERSAAWIAGQQAKIDTSLAAFELAASGFSGRVDIGVIAVGCALGYLDLRFPQMTWPERHPVTAGWYAGFATRPSMLATRPPSA